ncbi:hypothetical protein [Belliella aquatica]|uniref:Uncharacterized protein n=1 Tax=Belliella aquatica TaxID=1323734 RepID=A0ABQ1LUR7_9BACT|nr:hypothetical protein [Belliella aquatica]MCH7407259.1 hypothetical protein [Belliella aquatica]GGC29404.1 hypothetical protein GCM10010993_05360 [Belliella aquatica]
MKKSEFAFLLLLVLLGVQVLALDTFSSKEEDTCKLELSDEGTFVTTNTEIDVHLGNLEALLPSINSISFLSKNKINSQDFGLSSPVRPEQILNTISFNIIEPSSLVVPKILDFLHPYLFFY